MTRSEIKSSGDGGTSATEGDGFCVMTVTAKPVGTPKLVCCHNVNLGTISEAGVTYLFTGDFSWRNTSQGGTQTDYSFKPNKTGFKVGLEGQVFGRSNSFIFSEKPDWEHRFHQLSFKYTTVERDIGKPIQLSLTLHGENSRAGSVELLTDNWQVIVADATASSLKSNQSDGPKPAADGLGLLLN